MSGQRRRGRELAVQALYEMEITGDRSAERVGKLAEHFGATHETRRFAGALVGSVIERGEQIDALLATALEHWSVDRLSKVERNVLRIAVAELTATEPPPTAVVIDEAIEIARRFGAEGAEGLVNGVLDRIARELAAGAVDVAAGETTKA